MRRFLNHWATPGIVFTVAFAFAACSEALDGATGAGDCPPDQTTTGMGDGGTGSEQAPGGVITTGDEDNTFDHFNDPGESGQKDPFEILKERAQEGPPEIRTRLHSCTKVSYAALGEFLASRGVDLDKTAPNNQPKTAGQLYKAGGDALGAARFDAREGETYFHTASGATKLFDIFVQAAPEIIANVEKVEACKLNGVGKPMFDPMTGACVYESLSCVMGRPATEDDLAICDLMLDTAKTGDLADLAIKRNITVAAFLAAAHTCE